MLSGLVVAPSPPPHPSLRVTFSHGGEGKNYTLAHRERVAKGRVRGIKLSFSTDAKTKPEEAEFLSASSG